jgi:hypothetical protein
MEVPLQLAYPPPGMDEIMLDPGARRLRIAAVFE